jgi:hypothetical protein
MLPLTFYLLSSNRRPTTTDLFEIIRAALEPNDNTDINLRCTPPPAKFLRQWEPAKPEKERTAIEVPLKRLAGATARYADHPTKKFRYGRNGRTWFRMHDSIPESGARTYGPAAGARASSKASSTGWAAGICGPTSGSACGHSRASPSTTGRPQKRFVWDAEELRRISGSTLPGRNYGLREMVPAPGSIALLHELFHSVAHPKPSKSG